MMGIRLGLAALYTPLHHGRKLAGSPTTVNGPACTYPRGFRRAHFVLGRSASSRRKLCSSSKSTSTSSTNISSAFESQGRQGCAMGSSKARRARVGLALGGVASFVAAAALARERHLPESFSEWDDKLVWEEVHELAQLSNMTNKDPSLIAKWFDCHGYTGCLVVRELPEVSSRYFVHVGHLPGEEHRRVHHIAIRGTVSLADLSIDLKSRQVFDEECGCFFHAGFKQVADAVAEDVEQFLEDGAEVKLAGHSLGGAVAVIVAAKLKLRGYDVEQVMTFGAPMVTNAAGAAFLRDFLPVMRVTHERDPIPLTPLNRARSSSSTSSSQDDPTPPPGFEEELLEEESGPPAGEELEKLSAAANVTVQVVAVGGGEAAATAAAAIASGVANSSGGAGEGKASKLNGVLVGAGGAPTDAARLPVDSSSAYSHFGSQVVLLRRKKCIECFREESTSASPPSRAARLEKLLTLRGGVWDDIWGPAPGSQASVVEGVPPAGVEECEHCPSRGKTYYDPTGEDGSFFDSAWLRLSNVNYIHRMNRYEKEIADRLEHHLSRDPGVGEEVANSSPFSEDGVEDTPEPP